jgi:hypothetical protein
LVADKVTGLTSSFVLSKIGTGNITNAYIGNVIQSTTYNPSAGQGWQLDKTGGINAANITIRDNTGAVLLSSGGVLAPHIANAGDSINRCNPKYCVIADDDTLNSMVVTVGSVSKARVFGLFVMTVTNSGSGAVLYSDDVNNLNITIQPYKKWLLSIYVQGDVVGATGSVDVVENHLGAVIPPSQGARGFTIAQAGVKQLVQYEIDLTARAITQVAIRVRVNTAHNSQPVIFFPPMLELQRGRTLSPSPWVEPKIGRITPANASTYIADASIGTAHINDASITTAKIEDLSVNTIKIKGNAVTLPILTYTAGYTTVYGGNYGIVQTVTVQNQDTVAAQKCQIIASIDSVTGARAVVHRTGGSNVSAERTLTDGRFFEVCTYTIPAGATETFTIQARSASGSSSPVTVSRRYLSAVIYMR